MKTADYVLLARTATLLMSFVLTSCAGDEVDGSGQLADANLSSGLYHLPMRADAVTLELSDDHTFRWLVQGCDYGDNDHGRWSIAKGAVRLEPPEERATFRWFGELARLDVSTLMFSDAPGTEPGLRVTLVEQGVSRVQGWVPGGVCAVCEGALGPTGQQACDAPFQQLDELERSE